MQSFEFEIVLNCPLALVFPIYTDIERWCNRNVFGEIRWVKGRPWEEGSRLRIETRVPIRSTVDQVVQHFSPNESVSYLSHVFGITCETRVTFQKGFGGTDRDSRRDAVGGQAFSSARFCDRTGD